MRLIRGWRAALMGLVVTGALAQAGAAQQLSALARLDAEASAISVPAEGQLQLDFAISQPVPWRVRVLADPARLVVDMREVEWSGIELVEAGARAPEGLALPFEGLRAGTFRAGWSRLVLELSEPMLVQRAEMRTDPAGDGTARLQLGLARATMADFARAAALPEPAQWALPKPVVLGVAPARLPSAGEDLVVVLDPGHGGLDPGAEREGTREADLMLTFARVLKEELLRAGGYKVVMTRDDDVFVPLETRISIARAARAHVFLSLHADALAEGEAQGTTLYTLADEASDAATLSLAERHERDDLLAGIDLRAQDDVVASVLMDMARTETTPRINRLAGALEGAIKEGGLRMHRHAHQHGTFSVLKSPDIPSVLVEVGFMSSAADLKRLNDPEWRIRMAQAIRLGLRAWADEDLTLRELRRE